jgi:hypothetical protein
MSKKVKFMGVSDSEEKPAKKLISSDEESLNEPSKAIKKSKKDKKSKTDKKSKKDKKSKIDFDELAFIKSKKTIIKESK